jgi:excisionase family DNA binding protein
VRRTTPFTREGDVGGWDVEGDGLQRINGIGYRGTEIGHGAWTCREEPEPRWSGEDLQNRGRCGHSPNDPASETAASVGNDAVVESQGDRLVFTVEEAAYLLNISRALADGLLARGEISSIRLGRRIAIPRRQLEILLAGPVC